MCKEPRKFVCIPALTNVGRGCYLRDRALTGQIHNLSMT